MRSDKLAICLALLITAGCGAISDDLLPSGEDKRPASEKEATACVQAPDFNASDTMGNAVTLSSVVSAHRGVVLYFTMWCPTCLGDMDYMLSSVIPSYPDVEFFAVDYVSGTVAESQSASINYSGTALTVLADVPPHTVQNSFTATMATTVVIDRAGCIRMKEAFKEARLPAVLESLP